MSAGICLQQIYSVIILHSNILKIRGRFLQWGYIHYCVYNSIVLYTLCNTRLRNIVIIYIHIHNIYIYMIKILRSEAS